VGEQFKLWKFLDGLKDQLEVLKRDANPKKASKGKKVSLKTRQVAEAGKRVYVCSYSISNGTMPRDVQFVSGMEASSRSGSVCSPGGPVTRFHLAPNQFVSQGSGVGSLFATSVSQGLCLRVYGGSTGDVSINVTLPLSNLRFVRWLK
jgi:hypothetical protein